MAVSLEMLFKGFFVNLIITAVTVGILLIPGILLTLLAKKAPIIGKIFGWLSIPFECICPIAMILCLYYLFPGMRTLLGGTDVSAIFMAILALTVAYLGYMPARFVPEYSFLKNISYNSLGLISAIFKWSFCVFAIGGQDLLFYARNMMNRNYQTGILWVPLAVCFVCLLGIELLRRIVKQFMK